MDTSLRKARQDIGLNYFKFIFILNILSLLFFAIVLYLYNFKDHIAQLESSWVSITSVLLLNMLHIAYLYQGFAYVDISHIRMHVIVVAYFIGLLAYITSNLIFTPLESGVAVGFMVSVFALNVLIICLDIYVLYAYTQAFTGNDTRRCRDGLECNGLAYHTTIYNAYFIRQMFNASMKVYLYFIILNYSYWLITAKLYFLIARLVKLALNPIVLVTSIGCWNQEIFCARIFFLSVMSLNMMYDLVTLVLVYARVLDLGPVKTDFIINTTATIIWNIIVQLYGILDLMNFGSGLENICLLNNRNKYRPLKI